MASKNHPKLSELYITVLLCTYLIKEEEKVVGTLRKLGELIGSDEKLEVLFTTCIMRGKSRIRRMKRKVGNKGK